MNKPITTSTVIAWSVVVLGLNLWLLSTIFAPFFGWWLPA